MNEQRIRRAPRSIILTSSHYIICPQSHAIAIRDITDTSISGPQFPDRVNLAEALGVDAWFHFIAADALEPWCFMYHAGENEGLL